MKVIFGSSGWKMNIDLNAICKLEGKKEDIAECGKKKYKLAYPKAKIKKIFKLIIQNIYEDDKLDEIQGYLKKHSKGYEKIFSETRQKLGR